MRASLAGELPRTEALRRYAAIHEREAEHYAKLLRAQGRIPEIEPRRLGRWPAASASAPCSAGSSARYMSHLRVDELAAVPA